MTTPAINTPYSIISDALFEAKIIQEGQTPDGDVLARNLRRLTEVVNLEATQGLKLFLQEDMSVTLVAGTATYTLTVSSLKPLRVQQGYYLDTLGNRRPIYPISWQEYLSLSNPTQQGAISQYFINKQATTLTATFWLTPDTEAATGTAHLLTQRQVSPPINLTTDTVFPIEWATFLKWALADESSSGQPTAVQQKCMMKAQAARTMLQDWDVEDTPTYFQVDARFVSGSRFR